MDSRLEEASHAGDLRALDRLIQEDRLLLHKLSAAIPSVDNNPLHIAAVHGHADFVRKILSLNPGLVKDTNVDGLTALHLASAQGHLPVVMELINTSQGSDLCRIHNRDGLMPVHTAAVKGRVPVLRALLEKSPELLEELLSDGETILHCAVKSGCYEAVQILIERMTDNQVSLNSKDDKGNTVLHLAAARRQLKSIRMLLTKSDMKVNELNVRGLTALDVLLESPNQNGDMTLVNMIMAKGGKTSSQLHPQKPVPSIPPLKESRILCPRPRFQNWLKLILRGMRSLGLTPASQSEIQNSKEKPSNNSKTLSVVATLIATITFQPIMSPPGGFDSNTGYATHVKHLRKFLVFDIIGLFSSLSVILLLMCVEHRRKKMLIKFLVWVVWVAAYSTALAFTSAAVIVFPNSPAVTFLIYIWYVIFDITVIWFYLRYTIYLFVGVGWWEAIPLDRQTDSKWALFAKRVLVLMLVAVTPVLVMIPGPDFLVEVFFTCNMSTSPHFWNNFLLHCWVVVLEVPQVYICLRFTVYLLGLAGFCNGQESHIQVSRFNVVKKRVLIIILIGMTSSLLGYQVYYLQVAMWSPNNFSNNIFHFVCKN